MSLREGSDDEFEEKLSSGELGDKKKAVVIIFLYLFT